MVDTGARRRRRADPGTPADYLDAVRRAPDDPFFAGWGLNTPDNPVFDGMHEASALVAGATLAPPRRCGAARPPRAVNIAGGLHHAMPARASGFCVYNDPAVAIARLLDLGAERVAYVDIDVHHGDGVQADLLRRPAGAHDQPARDAAGAVPGHRLPGRDRRPGRRGHARSTSPLPPGTDDAGWLRAFHAVVPSVLRAFRPQLLFTQCGADAHRLDPLADLRLTVDGQRAAYLALRDLADELCDGRWVATGGGGYALVEVVPRAWTHLLAVATGEPLDPATPTPAAWRDAGRASAVPARESRRRDDRRRRRRRTTPWQPGEPDDRSTGRSLATRAAVFPLHGLDPHDPRD